jgi:hypothetical protein
MEENEPNQRRPRTSSPAFSTSDQPAPPAKPAKAPPAVTFRPPTGDKPHSGTGTDATGAPSSSRPQRNPAESTQRKAAPTRPAKSTPAAEPGSGPAEPAPKPAPPARTRTRAAGKSQSSRVEAATDAPATTGEPRSAADAQPQTAPLKASPNKADAAGKAAPAKRQPRKAATPSKAAAPTKATATKTTPTKTTPTKAAPAAATPAEPAQAASTPAGPAQATPTPAEPAQATSNDATRAQATGSTPTPASGGTRPARSVTKRAAATVKAAAAEIAPAVVTPDMTTVPDERSAAEEAPASQGKTADQERKADQGTTASQRTTATRDATDSPEQATAPEHAAAAGNAPSADDELMPDDTPSLAAGVQEMTRSGATSPAAEPPATAPGQPGTAVPVGPTLPGAAASAADTLSGIRTEAWAALIADPGHAPELLAIAATQTIGPRAQEWISRTRAAYPGAGPDALARLAARQFTRFGSISSVFAAVAGSYAPIALLGAAAFTHAQLALHVAAAYGLDPSDRERAVELLVLTRVHPSREDAEAALTAAEQHRYENTGLTEAGVRLGRRIAMQVVGWAAVRAVNRFLPGTSLLVAGLTSRGAAQAMATRAMAHYRGQSQLSQSLGSSV